MHAVRILDVQSAGGQCIRARVSLMPFAVRPGSPMAMLAEELAGIIHNHAAQNKPLPVAQLVGLMEAHGHAVDCLHGIGGETIYLAGSDWSDSVTLCIEPL